MCIRDRVNIIPMHRCIFGKERHKINAKLFHYLLDSSIEVLPMVLPRESIIILTDEKTSAMSHAFIAFTLLVGQGRGAGRVKETSN